MWRVVTDRFSDVHNAIESKAAQRRHAKIDVACDVPERVAACIAVRGCVVELAGTDAVEHDDDDSGKRWEHR
jgi:hypothetical protein